MSINRVNTTVQEQNFTFLKNESSILHTTDTNKITINGVNVIVNKPKRGDLMFIRNNKVIWIDGLSITPEQLPQDYIPVGICLFVNDNKALIRYYKEELYPWAATDRADIIIDNENELYDGFAKSITGTINGNDFSMFIPSTIMSRIEFVEFFNNNISTINKNYSVELVDPSTGQPAQITGSNNDSQYRYMLIANGINSITIANHSVSLHRIIGYHAGVEEVKNYYLNNGFVKDWGGGCCRAKYIDYIKNNQSANAPTSEMTEISKVPGGISGGRIPVTLNAFETNANCAILRQTFDNYNKYIDSMMIKYPCGKGLAITKLSSGKENTHKLRDCTFLDNNSTTYNKQKPLYPAANWATSIFFDINGLTSGNWWVPSVTEIVKIMRDITYGTSAWDSNPDIINRVLDKLKNFGWSMINASTAYTTSSKYGPNFAWVYDKGSLGYGDFFRKNRTMAITIYEF